MSTLDNTRTAMDIEPVHVEHAEHMDHEPVAQHDQTILPVADPETVVQTVSNAGSMNDEPFQLLDNNGNSVNGDNDAMDQETEEYTVVGSTDEMDDEMREAIEEQREINRRQSNEEAESPLYPRDEAVVQSVKQQLKNAYSKSPTETVRAPRKERDTDIMGFADSLAEELSCPICAELLDIPVTLIPCLHTFCSSCITTWFIQAPRTVATTSCPLCKIRVKATKPNPGIASLIEKTLQYHVPRGIAELEESMREIEAAKARERATREAALREAVLEDVIAPTTPTTEDERETPNGGDPVADSATEPTVTETSEARPEGLVTIEEYTLGEERPEQFPVSGLHPISANGEIRVSLSVSLHVSCDVCQRDRIEFERHYHCGRCYEYDVCLSCYRNSDDSGRKCQCDESTEGYQELMLRRYERQTGRLETGVFCDSCDRLANDHYWHCDECAKGDFDFCNACVKQGFHCTHALTAKNCTVLDILHPIIYNSNLYVQQNPRLRHRYYNYYCYCDRCHGDLKHPLRYWHCGSMDCKPTYDYDICEGCKDVLDERERTVDEANRRRNPDMDLCPKGHPMCLLQLNEQGQRVVLYSAACGWTQNLGGAPPREMEVDREGVDVANRPNNPHRRGFMPGAQNLLVADAPVVQPETVASEVDAPGVTDRVNQTETEAAGLANQASRLIEAVEAQNSTQEAGELQPQTEEAASQEEIHDETHPVAHTPADDFSQLAQESSQPKVPETETPVSKPAPRRSTAELTTRTHTMKKDFWGECRRGELEVPIGGKVVGVVDVGLKMKSGWYCGRFGLFKVDEDEV